jgi:DNA-binding NtrC family response regulator
LVHHFIKIFNRPNRRVKGISNEAMRILTSYYWPGNIRELENTIERAFALGSDEIITVQDLPSAVVQNSQKILRPEDDQFKSLEEVEKEIITKTLQRVGGDKMEAARILQINRSTLYRKLHRYGIS